MRHHPGFGYLVKLEELQPLVYRFLGINAGAVLANAIDADERDDIESSLWELGKHIPFWSTEISAIKFVEEDVITELIETDVWYVCFAADELGVACDPPRPQMKALTDLGITPQLCSWAIFG